MKLLILFAMASNLYDLDGSILRDTNNPPLTDKGATLTYAELDANFVKSYNAIQDIVSGENVTAYDNAATYDYYSTDVYEKYASYNGRMYKAIYQGSPSAFSGVTPDESDPVSVLYWEQVSLAQLLPNIMALADLANSINVGTKGCCIQYCTAWQSSNSKTLQSAPLDITGLPAPGAGKIIVPKFIAYKLDAGGVPYDFPATGLFIAPSTVAIATSVAQGEVGHIPQAYINSSADISYTSVCPAGFATNDKWQLKAVSNATVGNGVYYFKVIYQIEDAPF